MAEMSDWLNAASPEKPAKLASEATVTASVEQLSRQPAQMRCNGLTAEALDDEEFDDDDGFTCPCCCRR
jgi:hypothetical protein